MNDLTQLLISHGGPVLFAVIFAEQAGLPLPSAPWLLAAGALSATGKLNAVLALALTALACVIADSLWFYVGRRGGQRVLRLFCRVSLAPNACVDRTKGVFERHGLQALVAAKFIPGLGAVMPPLAGALGVGAARFVLLDGLGSLIYGGFYISAGFLFHNQLQKLMAALSRFGFSVLVLALVLVSSYVVFKFIRRSQNLMGRIRDGTAESHENAAIDENVAISGVLAPQVAAYIVGDNTRSLERENVAFTITNTVAQSAPADAPSSFAQATPCEL